MDSSQTIQQLLCPFCSSPIDSTAFFCPVCGKNVKQKPLSTTIPTQIGLYLVSVLLPPLFIGRTIKYIASPNPDAKRIGVISLVLTIAALGVGIWLAITVTGKLTQELNQQVNQYQNIGF